VENPVAEISLNEIMLFNQLFLNNSHGNSVPKWDRLLMTSA